MKRYTVLVLSVVIGLLVVGAARYTVSVDPRVYVLTADPNDPIYQGLAVNKVLLPSNWTEKFGNNERAILFFQMTVNRAEILKLKDRVTALEPVDPNQSKGTP